MLRFLGKTTSSAARSGGSPPTEAFAVGDDVLSAWELVNASQSDEEDLYSYDSDGTASTVGEMEPAPTEEEEEEDGEGGDAEEDELEPARCDFVSASDLIAIQAMSVSPPMTLPVEMARNYAEEYCDDVVDDDDDVDDDYDVDDELVPWKLKGRFGKQRIQKMGVRKMGQRGGPKLTAKKLPYYDNRPGFTHGKRR